MRKITLLILLVFTITVQGQDKLLSSIEETYNGTTWENSIAHNYEYDSNKNLVSETELLWETGVWKNDEKIIYTYNASNNATEILYQQWNATTNAFENFGKVFCTYTNGILSQYLYKIWENSQWVDNEIFYYRYNLNKTVQYSDGWDWVGNQWMVKSREIIMFNTNNQIIEDFGENVVNNLWQNDFRGVYTHTNNKITDVVNEEWSQSGGWAENERTEYQFDANGNRISKTSVYNSNSNFKDEYTYDNLNLMSSFAHPFRDKTGFDYLFESFPYVNKILVSNQYNFDTATSSYKESSRTTYNYNSTITLGTNQYEIANTTITVFPNPTTSILNIDFSNAVTIDKVVVVDATGKTVLQQNQNTSQINVENLTAGLYIIEAFSGNEKFTSKFVKK